ncbi:hypothetical protein [Streptomyces sp. CAU 1734]|uniref:hypothetical protein n=1 Tax=Streptomyces sp. CAU 1734 TaxID=3140360 RepID=UPI00325FE1B9
MSETITLRRPGPRVRDSTGSLVPGPPVLITVENCAVMSPYGVTVGSSSETHDASSAVTTRRVLAAPLGTDVWADDEILRGSEVWQVIGRPLVFPLTSLARVEAALEEVTG